MKWVFAALGIVPWTLIFAHKGESIQLMWLVFQFVNISAGVIYIKLDAILTKLDKGRN